MLGLVIGLVTHMPALLVASVSRQAIRQPKVITLMTMISISVTWFSKARLA